MDPSGIAAAAFLLSLERVCYVWAWHHTESFREFCGLRWVARLGEPVDVLQSLFYAFKVIQAGVFLVWCLEYGDGVLWAASRNSMAATLLGAGLVAVGQCLNGAVFVRLRRAGVFYGDRFGYQLPRYEGFPFSVCKHPQYFGAALTVWGFFLITRFPAPDWVVLPLIQTLYYALGARLESGGAGSSDTTRSTRTSSVEQR